MPIKGATDRDSITPRFKSLGKLKKGESKDAARGRMPQDLDHFRFDSPDPLVIKAFHDAYGEEPRIIQPVYVQGRNLEEAFSSWRETYTQSNILKLRCDGENWVDWIEGPRTRHGSRPCEFDCKDVENKCPECEVKPVGRLELILPELWKAGHIGTVTLITHGWHDISEIASKLVAAEPLDGKPFTLWREDERIGAPNLKTGKRMKVTKSLVHIQLTDEFLRGEFEAAQVRAREALLPASVDEPYDPSYDEGVDAEYEDVPERPEPKPEAPTGTLEQSEKPKRQTQKLPIDKPELTVVDGKTLKQVFEEDPATLWGLVEQGHETALAALLKLGPVTWEGLWSSIGGDKDVRWWKILGYNAQNHASKAIAGVDEDKAFETLVRHQLAKEK